MEKKNKASASNLSDDTVTIGGGGDMTKKRKRREKKKEEKEMKGKRKDNEQEKEIPFDRMRSGQAIDIPEPNFFHVALAELALSIRNKLVNDELEMLEFVRLRKVYCHSHAGYYYTLSLEAKDGNGIVRRCKAAVLNKPWGSTLEMFKVKEMVEVNTNVKV